MALTVLSFLAFTGLVALITYLKTKDENIQSNDGFFLGGRSLTGGIIAGSLLLTNLSAASFTGVNGQGYTDNMSPMGFEVLTGIILVFVGLFLIPRYLRQGLTTIPTYLEDRYDKSVKNLISILFLFSFVLATLPVILYSGAIVLSNIFDISGLFGISYTASIWVSVIALGLIGAIYALFGGLKAVAVSDTINGFGMLIGGFLIPIFGLIYLGGDGGFSEGLNTLLTENPEKLNAIGSSGDPVPFWAGLTGLILIHLFYWGTNQAVIQRVLGAKSLAEGQKGTMFAGLLKVLVTPFIVLLPGIIAFHIYGAGFEDPDAIYVQLVNDVLPAPFVGFFVAVMFGVILSSFNSLLNSATTLFALDIYKPMFGQDMSEKEVIEKSKWFGYVVVAVTIIVAPFIANAPAGLFDHLQTFTSLFNIPIFTVVFIGYVAPKVPSIAAKVAIGFFVLTYGTLQFIIQPDLHYLYQLAILFVIAAAIMLIIGKIKPREEAFEIPEAKVVDLKPWKYRYEFGGFVVFAMIAMYILFSPIGVASGEGLTMIGIIAIIISAIVLAFIVKIAKSKSETLEGVPEGGVSQSSE